MFELGSALYRILYIVFDLMSLELKLLAMKEVEIKLGKVRYIFKYKVFLDIALYCSTRYNLISISSSIS